MQTINRQEFKYFIKKDDVPSMRSFLGNALIPDIFSEDGSYQISSLYFDTLYDDDFNQKLDGIMYREKYRIRIYDNDIATAKFEVKRKLNNCIQKLSSKISESDLFDIYQGNYSVLEKYKGLEYVPARLEYLGYSPINIVTYNREAYTLPINNIRVTIDSDLRTHGFQTDLVNLTESPMIHVQKSGLDILEIKFENYIPNYIVDFLSTFASVRSSVSKYALSRVHSNTEINGDEPLIAF